MRLAVTMYREGTMLKRHHTVGEGLLVGALGAATVALWFITR